VKLLRRCFETLQAQSCVRFVWHVLDDGSADRTAAAVADWSLTAPFQVKLHSRVNAGKHAALNHLLGVVTCPLVLILDDDDGLYPGAIQMILDRAPEILRPGITGLIANQFCAGTGAALGRPLPTGLLVTTGRDLYDRCRHIGDTFRVYRRDVITRARFPEYKSEHFVPENVLFDAVDSRGRLLVDHRRFSWAEYQVSGLSRRALELRHTNPRGYLASLGSSSCAASTLEARFRFSTLFWTWHRAKVLEVDPAYRPEGTVGVLGRIASIGCRLMRRPAWMFGARVAQERP